MSMDTGQLPFLIAAFFILLLLNAVFVFAETAASRSRDKRLEELVASGLGRAEAALRAGKELGAQIEAARFATTLITLVLGWVAGPLLYGAVRGALSPALTPGLASALSAALALFLISVSYLVFAELLPQRLGSSKLTGSGLPERLALGIHRIGYPFIALAHRLANALSPLFGISKSTAEAPDLSSSQLSLIALRSRSKGARGATQREILQSYFAFKERTVGELMIPRQDVAAIPSSMKLREARDAVRQFGFTRYPVYDGEQESMIGVVHFRELVDAADVSPRAPVSDVMHVAVTLSPRTPASEALQTMQARGSHLAVVAAESGTAVGIITLEDLLREFLLESPDRTDSAPLPRSVEVAPGVFEIDSSLVVQEVEDLLDVDLQYAGLETIGGYVFGRLGRKPKVGDSVKADGVIFDVIDVRGTRIRRLRAQRSREAPPPKSPATP